MPILSQLVAPEVVIMTIHDATCDDKIDIMATSDFQWQLMREEFINIFSDQRLTFILSIAI